MSLALKFGKDCNSFDVYGIVGVTTKNVDIEYSVEADGITVNIWMYGKIAKISSLSLSLLWSRIDSTL